MCKDASLSAGAGTDVPREETVRVAAFGAQGPSSPSFRIRGALPGAALAPHGVQVSLMPLFSAEQEREFRTGGAWTKMRTVLSARETLRAQLPAPVDVTWILRQADILASMKIEELAIGDRRFVLDVDDAIWLDRSRPSGAHPLAFLKGTSRKIERLAQRADIVVAGNAYLADWLAQYADAITVIPSLVDTELSVQRAHQEGDKVVLGWIGSPSSFRHLQGLAAPLARVATLAPDIRFELWSMGGSRTAVPGMQNVSVPWSQQAESTFVERMDIGLMPLADNPWTRGKCAFKAIQYMAARIPVVADDVGVSAEVVGDGHAGIVVRSPDEWTEAIVMLARDCDMRTRLGEHGRKRVIAHYSYDRWLPDLAQALTGEQARRGASATSTSLTADDLP
jgi:glycosyl transferase family 1